MDRAKLKLQVIKFHLFRTSISPTCQSQSKALQVWRDQSRKHTYTANQSTADSTRLEARLLDAVTRVPNMALECFAVRTLGEPKAAVAGAMFVAYLCEAQVNGGCIQRKDRNIPMLRLMGIRIYGQDSRRESAIGRS